MSAYFNNTLIIGDKSWSGPEHDIINDLNYTLTVQYLSGQTAFNALLAERYAKRQPILFWVWRPNMLFSVYDLVRVSIPNSSKSIIIGTSHSFFWRPQIDNYYPSEILGKIMWPTLKDFSPEAAYMVQSYSMNSNDLTAMLGQIYLNKTNFEVACQWLTENEQVWQNWIRPCKLHSTTKPLSFVVIILCFISEFCRGRSRSSNNNVGLNGPVQRLRGILLGSDCQVVSHRGNS